ncbi:MAG: adenylate/guanylate cyclase domain-containing protein [Thermoanaerobaculia bacterium]
MRHSESESGARTIQPPTGIVTLMFTDIVGSTMLRDTLIAQHGEGEGNRLYRERYLDPHNVRIREFLEKHDGFEVKTNGDSFMVAFAQPEDAVMCAAAIQRSLRGDPIRTDTTPLAVRLGMHTGQATYVERDGKPDYDGHAVNIAARVESLLKGGERIYCSGETKALAKMGPGIRFHSYGPYVLKGVSSKVEIIDVLWDEAMQPVLPEQPQDGLPYPWLTRWVGREREMTELAEALRASRLVTLHGTGGVGKTRLAVETLLAHGGGLPREVVFVR